MIVARGSQVVGFFCDAAQIHDSIACVWLKAFIPNLCMRLAARVRRSNSSVTNRPKVRPDVLDDACGGPFRRDFWSHWAGRNIHTGTPILIA
jgi:hypothetical protein